MNRIKAIIARIVNGPVYTDAQLEAFMETGYFPNLAARDQYRAMVIRDLEEGGYIATVTIRY